MSNPMVDAVRFRSSFRRATASRPARADRVCARIRSVFASPCQPDLVEQGGVIFEATREGGVGRARPRPPGTRGRVGSAARTPGSVRRRAPRTARLLRVGASSGCATAGRVPHEASARPCSCCKFVVSTAPLKDGGQVVEARGYVRVRFSEYVRSKTARARTEERLRFGVAPQGIEDRRQRPRGRPRWLDVRAPSSDSRISTERAANGSAVAYSPRAWARPPRL